MIKEVTQTHFAPKHQNMMFYVMRLAFVQEKTKIGVEKSVKCSALRALGITTQTSM